jgi:hypothetical protein
MATCASSAAPLHGADGQRLKVPHMGWNRGRPAPPHPLWQGIADGERFYFVHSYYVHAVDRDLVAGSVDYGVRPTQRWPGTTCLQCSFTRRKATGRAAAAAQFSELGRNMLIIPAIDLKDGQCVRLRQGEMDDSTVFSDDPVATAQRWVDAGCRRLHLVDLNGAFAGEPVNGEAVTAIAARLPGAADPDRRWHPQSRDHRALPRAPG